MFWKVLLRPVEEVRGGMTLGEGKESRVVGGSILATIFLYSESKFW